MYDYSGYGYDYGYTQTATTGLAVAGGIVLIVGLIVSNWEKIEDILLRSTRKNR